jgi:methyl-accepting chemotaxis protein
MTDYLVATTLLVIIIWYSKQINIKSSTLIADEIKSKMLQNEAMMNMLNKTQQSSVKLFQSSSELSHLASIISQNANEQSATSEEIASSMEEMLNTIVSTTENAEYTKKITTQTANETELSRGILERTIKAVNKISGKISIISEISGKTDLLSINAAIEASRAGDSGRGFAVVAQEIRKLADKTKLASAEIESLAHDGQEISKNAGEKLAKLLPEIIKSAQLVENIVHMSREQQAGVENINQSIQQLSQITVNNADASEKMANAAKDLAQQAELLKNLTAYMQADNTLTGGS